MIKSVLSALFGSVFGAINDWLSERRKEKTLREAGGLEAENNNLENALEKSKDARDREGLINGLDNDALSDRMRDTREKIRESRKPKD